MLIELSRFEGDSFIARLSTPRHTPSVTVPEEETDERRFCVVRTLDF